MQPMTPSTRNSMMINTVHHATVCYRRRDNSRKLSMSTMMKLLMLTLLSKITTATFEIPEPIPTATFNDVTFDNEITFFYNNIDDRELQVNLYNLDGSNNCDTTSPMDAKYLEIVSSEKGCDPGCELDGSDTTLLLITDVKQNYISEIWSLADNVATIKWCTRVDSGENVNGTYIIQDFQETIYTLTLDLEQAPQSFDTVKRRVDVDTKSSSSNVNYNVQATWIQQESDCSGTPTAYSTAIDQQTNVMLCIHVDTSNVRIKNIANMNFVDGALTQPVVTNGGVANSVSTVANEATQYVTINTILSSVFYNNIPAGSEETVSVVGTVNLEFFTRRLRGLSQDEGISNGVAAFETSFKIKNHDVASSFTFENTNEQDEDGDEYDSLEGGAESMYEQAPSSENTHVHLIPMPSYPPSQTLTRDKEEKSLVDVIVPIVGIVAFAFVVSFHLYLKHTMELQLLRDKKAKSAADEESETITVSTSKSSKW